jgi:hypothetical protein
VDAKKFGGAKRVNFLGAPLSSTLSILISEKLNILQRLLNGRSLSSIILGPVWRSYGWHGITILCSISLLISLLIMSVIALKERDIEGGHYDCYIKNCKGIRL